MRTTRFQLMHMLTGVLVAIFLGIHMVRMHLDSILDWFGVNTTESTSFTSMMDRASQGIWVFVYIALLAVALYHALYGLRGIIMEWKPSAKTSRITGWPFLILGAAIFAWGTYVPLDLLFG